MLVQLVRRAVTPHAHLACLLLLLVVSSTPPLPRQSLSSSTQLCFFAHRGFFYCEFNTSILSPPEGTVILSIPVSLHLTADVTKCSAAWAEGLGISTDAFMYDQLLLQTLPMVQTCQPNDTQTPLTLLESVLTDPIQPAPIQRLCGLPL